MTQPASPIASDTVAGTAAQDGADLAADERARRFDVPAPRYTSYPTVPAWSERFGADDHALALARAALRPGPLSLYVHVPFCREMCLYCGCNVVVARSRAIADRYLDDVAQEVDLVARLLRPRREVARIHWGGGTPTFLDVAQLERLWATLAGRFRVLPDAEVAIEVDPAATRPEQIDHLAALGFRRLSVGVQDFDPAVQRAVHREQTVEETRALLERARAAGFTSVNLDLIYGLPHQAPAGWSRTLEQAIGLRPDRLAVFSFAYVPRLRPHQRKLDAAAIPGGPAKLALQRIARERLGAAGYREIGMDHFALPGDELARALDQGRLWRDFQGYTVRRGVDTVALGATGISDFGDAYAQSERGLGAYRDALAAGRLPTSRGIWLSEDDRCRREVIVDLMCNGRADLGPDGADRFAPELARLGRFAEEGLLRVDGAAIILAEGGRRFVRNVAMVFDAYLRADGADRSGAAPEFSRAV